MSIEAVMRLAPVIPVLVIEDPDHARPIAEALVAGGLPALEVTLRTPAALEVIAEMARVEGAVVGAGTVVGEAQMNEAIAAGARFIVSPGITPWLCEAARDCGAAFLPGISTASEIMLGLEFGLRHFKFFPAEASGGIAALKALAAPFAQCRFCPTGGIAAESAPLWLAEPHVLCVGGSWIVPRGAPDPAVIEDAARSATLLRN